jgi:hypothetical protein
MHTNRLNIRRFSAQYLIPRDHPAPEHIKARLDDAIAAPVLKESLPLVISSLLPANDDSVFLIRRLDLNVDVNAAWESDQLTRVILAQFARQLGVSLGEQENGGNVLHFANRATYLARFLLDLTRGVAWGRWYYESFAGLRLLTTSAALRTAVCASPDVGRDALLLLSEAESKSLLHALTRQDVRRVFDSVADTDARVGQSECFQLVWKAWDYVAADLKSSDDGLLALRLFLRASRERHEVIGPALKAASIALVSLARLLLESPTERRQQLVAALVHNDLASLYLAAGSSAEVLTPLLSCPSEWIADVIATLLSEKEVPPAETAEAATRRDTGFGGIFLLLPLLDELPLAAASGGWPNVDDATALTLVRFLVLVKCCTPQHKQRAFYDPLLRDLMLITGEITPAIIAEWSTRITESQLSAFAKEVECDLPNKQAEDLSFLKLPEPIPISPALDTVLNVAAQHVLRAFAWRLPDFANSSLMYLATNFLDFSATVETESDRHIVRLGRPPLNLLLSLTGVVRRTYRLSWLDAPFVLTQTEEA